MLNYLLLNEFWKDFIKLTKNFNSKPKVSK